MIKNKTKNTLLLLSTIVLLINSCLITGIAYSFTSDMQEYDIKPMSSMNLAEDTYPYKGIIKVYIVEPESRWIMDDGNPYHFGFLDYAINEEIELDYTEEITYSTEWNPKTTDFSDITEDNLLVIAAVFNQNVNQEYAYPPFSNPFNAHFLDASAGAKPGETESNIVTENFTHTVLVEEGTATWCPYCPAMANALYSVYNSDEYPFYFIAFVADKNPLAHERLIEMNFAAYPSSFFDGGNKVVVGGYDSERTYSTRIKSCGRRDVHELDLRLSVDWTTSDTVDIEVVVKNNEEITTNSPPQTPTIEGNTTGEFATNQAYEINTIDPDGNSVYYLIDWGDGETTDWLGPFASNVDITQSHNWTEKGTYQIRVKAKDIYDQESEWGSLEVSMPKNKKVTHPLLTWILSRFPIIDQFLV